MKKILEPIKQVPANVSNNESSITASAEESLKEREVEEILRIIGQSNTRSSLVGIIKRVYDKESGNGRDVTWGAMATYEMGHIHGIQSERKRRKEAQIAKELANLNEINSQEDSRMKKEIVMHEVSHYSELQALVGCTITDVEKVDPCEDAGGAFIRCYDKNGNEVSLCINEDNSWHFYDAKVVNVTAEQLGELAILAACSDIESVHFNNVDPLIGVVIKPIGMSAAGRVMTILRGIFPGLEVKESRWNFEGGVYLMYLCNDPNYYLNITVAVLPEDFIDGIDED